jgi:hypothetical protein
MFVYVCKHTIDRDLWSRCAVAIGSIMAPHCNDNACTNVHECLHMFCRRRHHAHPTALFLIRFHELWAAENPPNIMSYQPIHEKFMTTIAAEVRSGTFSWHHTWLAPTLQPKK